jgi:hypothetical protein
MFVHIDGYAGFIQFKGSVAGQGLRLAVAVVCVYIANVLLRQSVCAQHCSWAASSSGGRGGAPRAVGVLLGCPDLNFIDVLSCPCIIFWQAFPW